MWFRRLIALVLGAVLARTLHGRARDARPKPAPALRARPATPPDSPSPQIAAPLRPRRSRRRRLGLVGSGLALCALLAAGAVVALDRGGDEGGHTSRAAAFTDTEAARSFPEPGSAAPHDLANSPETAARESRISPGAPSDAEVRRELRQLERYNRGTLSGHAKGGGALDHGLARPARGCTRSGGRRDRGRQRDRPLSVSTRRRHGSFVDDAYDCSGSVSYALGGGRHAGQPGRLRRFDALGRSWTRALDHPVREQRACLHGGRRAALRHERARRPQGFALAGVAAPGGRVRRPALARSLTKLPPSAARKSTTNVPAIDAPAAVPA